MRWADIGLSSVRESDLPFVVLKELSGNSLNRTELMDNRGDAHVLVNNSGVSGQDLIKRLKVKSSDLMAMFRKVDDGYCKAGAMVSLTR